MLEDFRSGKTIEKIFVLDGCQDGPIKSITREARKHDAIINYVAKENLKLDGECVPEAYIEEKAAS